MVTRRPPNPITPPSGIGPATAGQQLVNGNVPAGATATCLKNGVALGAANVTPLGLASYGPVTLVAGDSVSFAWALTGNTPAAKVPGTPPAPAVDPAVAAASAQASSRSSELSAATNDTGKTGSGSGPYTALARPTISGKPKVGESLIGYPGFWNAAAGLSYAWTVGGTVVSGQTSRRYVVQAADVGKDIVFVVTPNAGTAASSRPLTAFATFATLDDDTGTPITTDTGAVIELADRVIQLLAPYSATVSGRDFLANPKNTGFTYAVDDADIFVGPTSLPVSIYAPNMKIVNYWHSGKSQLSLVPDADGYAQGILPLTGIPNGALWIEPRGLIDSTDERLATSAIYAGMDVIVRGAATPSLNAIPPAAQAAGMTVVGFSEDFSAPLNVSSGNTLPTNGKWFGSQAFDPKGYGTSSFPPPEGPYGQMTVIDKMLRIRAKYDPVAYAAAGDPYNRNSGWMSGCLCTSFPDATTTVPKMGLGYYECELRVPVGVGTWPAFWLNDQGGLVLKAKGTPSAYGRETDILEQYNLTTGHVVTQHRYQPDPNDSTKTIDKSTGFGVAAGLDQECWAWIRVGCLTLSDRVEYYVNDVKVATDTKYNPPDRSDPSLEHIIVTMAMGGGWPLDVPPGKYYDCYFRNIRYFQKAA